MVLYFPTLVYYNIEYPNRHSLLLSCRSVKYLQVNTKSWILGFFSNSIPSIKKDDFLDEAFYHL